MILSGKVWKFGDNIDTDAIIPARYLNMSTAEELAQHCMEDVDTSYASGVQKGDIIVGGENFGCGSSREQAVICLKAAGVGAIIAKSFARIYFRNAINQGLAIIQCLELVDKAEQGDDISVNLREGTVRHRDTDYSFPPLPEEIMEILQVGGLIPYVRNKVGSGK